MIATQLDLTLRAAGIPIVGVAIGNPADRTTWLVLYDGAASDAQKAQGESIRAAFDPTATAVVTADLDRDANAALSKALKAVLCEVLETKLARTLTAGDASTLQAMFQKTVAYYKFIVNNGL